MRAAVAYYVAFLLLSCTQNVQAQIAKEQQVRNVVQALYASWSKENGEALSDLQMQYADSIMFFGKQTSKADFVAERSKFASRWPLRNYSVSGSQSIDCSSDTSCAADFLIEWEAASADQKRKSRGLAAVQLVLDQVGGKWLVTSESSKVLPSQRNVAARSEADCRKLTSNKADLSTCLYDIQKKESAPLQIMACSSKACAYRLPCKPDGEGRLCATSDWKFEMKPADYGYDIFITGVDGRVTKFTQCGTCMAADYEFGPLKAATYENVGSASVILKVPGGR